MLLVVSLIRSVVVEDGDIASEYSTGQGLVLEAVICTSSAVPVMMF